jgi:hypothetical protein
LPKLRIFPDEHCEFGTSSHEDLINEKFIFPAAKYHLFLIELNCSISGSVILAKND